MSQPTKPMLVTEMRAEYDREVAAAKADLMKASASKADTTAAERRFHSRRNTAVDVVSRWINKWKPPP